MGVGEIGFQECSSWLVMKGDNERLALRGRLSHEVAWEFVKNQIQSTYWLRLDSRILADQQLSSSATFWLRGSCDKTVPVYLVKVIVHLPQREPFVEIHSH